MTWSPILISLTVAILYGACSKNIKSNMGVFFSENDKTYIFFCCACFSITPCPFHDHASYILFSNFFICNITKGTCLPLRWFSFKLFYGQPILTVWQCRRGKKTNSRRVAFGLKQKKRTMLQWQKKKREFSLGYNKHVTYSISSPTIALLY